MTSPLESIRFNLRAGHYDTDSAGTINYLLRVIDRMAANIDLMQLAYLDPGNEKAPEPIDVDDVDDDCACMHRIQDDAGTTLVREYNPDCPEHGEPADHRSYACTFGGDSSHQWCDGTAEAAHTHDLPCACTCHQPEEARRG